MGEIVTCLEKLDIITSQNNKAIERYIELKEKLVRRNGQKEALYKLQKYGSIKN